MIQYTLCVYWQYRQTPPVKAEVGCGSECLFGTTKTTMLLQRTNRKQEVCVVQKCTAYTKPVDASCTCLILCPWMFVGKETLFFCSTLSVELGQVSSGIEFAVGLVVVYR